MKITTEQALRNFEFWSGGKERADDYTSEQLDEIEERLEELYPDGMTDTEINDLFWFEQEFIDELIGVNRQREEWKDDWEDVIRTILGHRIVFELEDDQIIAYYKDDLPPIDVIASVDVDEDETPEWHISEMMDDVIDCIKADFDVEFQEYDDDLKSINFNGTIYEIVYDADAEEMSMEDQEGRDYGISMSVEFENNVEYNINQFKEYALLELQNEQENGN